MWVENHEGNLVNLGKVEEITIKTSPEGDESAVFCDRRCVLFIGAHEDCVKCLDSLKELLGVGGL